MMASRRPQLFWSVVYTEDAGNALIATCLQNFPQRFHILAQDDGGAHRGYVPGRAGGVAHAALALSVSKKAIRSRNA